jgi:hypothetical protein
MEDWEFWNLNDNGTWNRRIGISKNSKIIHTFPTKPSPTNSILNGGHIGRTPRQWGQWIVGQTAAHGEAEAKVCIPQFVSHTHTKSIPTKPIPTKSIAIKPICNYIQSIKVSILTMDTSNMTLKIDGYYEY